MPGLHPGRQLCCGSWCELTCPFGPGRAGAQLCLGPSLSCHHQGVGQPVGTQDPDLPQVPLSLRSLWPRTHKIWGLIGAQAPLLLVSLASRSGSLAAFNSLLSLVNAGCQQTRFPRLTPVLPFSPPEPQLWLFFWFPDPRWRPVS